MSATKTKGPIIDPGMCRCCGNMKKCRLLNFEYEHLGRKEIYSDIMMDCFGLLLSNIDGEVKDRLICATCVVRLREASAFRSQVLMCEEAFLSKIHQDDDLNIKVELKNENANVMDDDSSIHDYSDSMDTINIQPDNENTREENARSNKTRIVIKSLESKEDEIMGKEKKSKAVRGNSVSAIKHLKMKKELLNRMHKLKSMLNQKVKPITAPTPRPPPKPRQVEPCHDRKLHHNIVTIVENSYVCPFKNRISNYYCYYCKEIFTDCNELRSHTLTHDPKSFEDYRELKKIPRIDISQIDCRLCSEKINDLDAFKSHISSVHNKIIYPSISNEFLTFRLNMDSLKCLECGCTFPFIDKLIEHMTDHFGKFVCDICGACFIDETTLTTHLRIHKKIDSSFPCDICGKAFKSNYSRQLHTATIHEKRAVVNCYKCEASFLSYAQRNRHLINVHGDKRRFPCDSCDKVFDVRKTLVEHTRKYHLQVYRHQCDVCEQKFYSPSVLKEHKVIHTGERNYKCDMCDKAYPRRQSLLDHIRSHNNDRKYKCDICHSTFTQNVILKNHMKSHNQGYDLIAAFDPR